MATAEHEHHCPFLNRPDERCAEHFHLDQLSHAFAYCFDRYNACPVYVERLVERRVRQQVSTVTQGQEHGRQTLVQITIPHRYAAGVRRRTVDHPARDFAQGKPLDPAAAAAQVAAQSAGDAKPIAAA